MPDKDDPGVGPDPSPSAEASVGRRGMGARAWPLVLAGAGLFLAGIVLGGILVLSVLLYRAPSDTILSPPPTDRSPSLLSLQGNKQGEGQEAALTPAPSPLPLPSARPLGPKVGWEAPAFMLRGQDGEEHALAAYRGRTVLLHFWASWCLPCRAEWPELLAFAEQYDASQVVLLAVNSEETAEVVDNFIGQDPLPFPVLLDGDGSVSQTYRVSALPTTFVIGPDGVIQQVVPGNIGVEELTRLVNR